MNTEFLTKHAEIRVRQRAIPPVVVDWLELFGTVEHQADAELVYFDRHSLRKLASYTGGFSGRLENINNAYLIRGNNGRILTAGYRDKHITRK